MGRLSPKTTVCSANFESSCVGQRFRQPRRTVLEEEVVPLILIKVVFLNQGLVTQPGVGFQQLPGVGLQQMPPGLGNSMDNIVAARGIFQQMNPRELQVVFQEINQRLNFQRQGGFVPERLGQARSEPDLPTFVRPEGHDTLPPVGRESRR